MPQYPSWNLTHLILLVLGLRPLRNSGQSKWYTKINPIGLVFGILQIALTLHTFLSEQRREAYYSHFANNIMDGTLQLKRLLAIFVPMAAIADVFLKYRPLAKFHQKINRLDEFLMSPDRKRTVNFDCHQEATEQKTRQVNFLAGVVIVAIECLSLVTGICYVLFGRQSKLPPWSTFYFYHVMLTMHVAMAMNIYTQLHTLGQRQDLFVAFVQSCSDLKFPNEKKQKEQARSRLQVGSGVPYYRVKRNGFI